ASVPVDPDRVGVTRANDRGVYPFAAFPQPLAENLFGISSPHATLMLDIRSDNAFLPRRSSAAVPAFHDPPRRDGPAPTPLARLPLYDLQPHRSNSFARFHYVLVPYTVY